MKLMYRKPCVKTVMVEPVRAIAGSVDLENGHKVNDDALNDNPDGFGDDFWN